MSITDEEWRNLSQQVPSPSSDAFIQSILAQRSSLIAEEKTQRTDASFKSSLSKTAQGACAIVDRIRRHEQENVWVPQVEEDLAKATDQPIFPGMMFMLAKDRMESTKLWKVVRRMPKGSLLHAHMDAMVEYDYLIRELLKLPGMHMSSDRPLTSAEAREDAVLSFRYRATNCNDGSVLGEDYEPGKFILLTKVADEFPGGREGFITWVKSRCSLSALDSHEQHHGLDAIWIKFGKCFLVVATMIHYEPMFRILLRRLMRNLRDDGVNWAELRVTWPLDYCRDRQELPEKDYTHMYKVIQEEVTRFKSTPEGDGFWGLTTIWTTVRTSDTRHLIENMRHCIATKKAFPYLIAGYDLVGEEELGRTLVDMLPELSWFLNECKREDVHLPFFFHAGETLGDGTSTDHNLFDAILLGTRRIGHGFSLYKHPLLIQKVKESNILIESCPISNEVLRLCSSITAHPLPALLARGVACSLCNDDPAMLGQDTPAMAHDFWQALQGWENLGLAGLASLAENSIRWSAFEDQSQDEWLAGVRTNLQEDSVKARRLRQWHKEWEDFCYWVVEEFSDEFGTR